MAAEIPQLNEKNGKRHKGKPLKGHLGLPDGLLEGNPRRFSDP
jgi:hypothetical protein